MNTQQAAERLSRLAFRWEDEKEYEDFADYTKAMTKLVPKGAKFVSGHQDPFGFKFELDGQLHQMVVRGEQVVVESIAKSFPQANESHTTKEETMSTQTKSTKKQSKPAAKKAPKAATPKTLNACQCGCGGTTYKNFVPGHDARLVGMIKRGELKRLTPFQTQFAQNHGIKLGESAKAPKAKPAAKKVAPAPAKAKAKKVVAE